MQSTDDSLGKLQSRADDAQTRLEVKRQDLIAQYAQLESTLSSLKGQGDYLTNAIAGLNK